MKFFSFYLNKIRLLLLLCIPVFSFASIEEAALEQANAYYRQGEAAKQRLLRQKAFNRALVQLKEIERQALPSQNQEKLDLALGNTYFQLEEYAWAILYYYRALNWNPNSQIARQGLEKAQLQLGLNPQTELPFLEQILSFDFWLPLPQRFALLFWSLILTFLALSLWIWIKRPLTKILALLFTIVSSFWLLTILLSSLLTPVEAVLIDSTGLYQEPDRQANQLSTNPLLPGFKVRVLATEKEGFWLKIKTPDGIIGYIPSQEIRLI